jgi:4Fe-4S ferredoxin
MLMPYEIVINERLCHGCGDCYTACPKTQLCLINEDHENLIFVVKKGKAQVVKSKLCDGCGMCIEACPVNAIKIIVPATEVTR